MLIGIDGRYAEGDLVGVGKYIHFLIRALAKRDIECLLFYSRKPKFKIQGENVRSIILPAPNRYYFEQVALPFALNKYKVDLYHAMGNIGVPLFCSVPAILTIHDLIPLEIGDYFCYSPASFLSKLSYNLRLRSSLFKADKIVAVSKYTKEQLFKKLHISSNKIRVIYSGPTSLKDGGKLPTKLVGMKYVLNHGGIDIRKNIHRLIEAFASVHINHTEIKLVITGENKIMQEKLNDLIAKLKLGSFVIFTGYVDDKTLTTIIKKAILICYPTLSEGFGFPVLEGFGAGIPVISSNVSAIPEIAGEAALLINPESPDSISKAIEKILSNPRLVNSMISKGKRTYNKFNWEKSADEYIDLYNSIK